MIVKDKYGSKINVTQAKSGKIIIPFADHVLTLTKEDAEKFCLYDIEDFNQEEFLNAYNGNIDNKWTDKEKHKFSEMPSDYCGKLEASK